MKRRRPRKIFVLDTNVILHDSACIQQFEENDVVIPITVIEELDNFKKGNGTINFHAREFVRTLDSLTGNSLFTRGVRIAPHLGHITVRLEKSFHPSIAANFSPDNPDHHILNTAYFLSEEHSPSRIVLVSKDGNLRMKAKAVGILAQDYTSDHVKDVSCLDAGYRFEEGVSEGIVDCMYRSPYSIPASSVSFRDPLTPNEFMILRNGNKSALAVYNPFAEEIQRVAKETAYGIQPRNAEQTFALSALRNNEVRLVSLSGKAGTGKTLLALAAALETRSDYQQIYMARPAVPLSNKDIGFLPGDLQSKLQPYMQPLFDNLDVIKNQFAATNPKYKRIDELVTNNKLVIAPLSHIRGRSLVKKFFIVDEAQNLTPHEVKTIITRAGEGTKMVFTGDVFQIDHPYLDSQSNGLSHLIEKMHGQKIYAHINLMKGERSVLADLASSLL